MEFEMEGLHLLALAFSAIVILYSDHEAFKYFTGKKALLSETFIQRSHALAWVGLSLMIVTGILLTLPAWTYRLQDPTFYVKMGMVLVLVWNGFAIGKLAKVASERPFKELTTGEQRTLMISGALSACGWVGAALIGFLFL